MRECPKTINDLRKMIYFKSEQNKINDKQLGDLLKLLKKKPTKQGKAKYNNVYDQVIDAWLILNEYIDIDYID